jgi:hypothetical protein
MGMKNEEVLGGKAGLVAMPTALTAFRGLCLAALVLVIAAAVTVASRPAAAIAHEAPTTVQEHVEEDSVIHGPAEERRLEQHTSTVTAPDAAAAASQTTGGPGEVGEWGPVIDWPVVGVHVALLENGKVLAYDSVGDGATETYPVHDFTRAMVWDPVAGTQAQVNVTTGFNIFCSGLAHLTDGSLFIAGGNKNNRLEGIVQTHSFDSDTNSWSLGPNMAAGRWYPSVTPLNDGEMLITEGGPNVPEVRKTDGSLRTLNTASLNLPLYPWIDVAPNGRAFYSGPSTTMRSLNPAGGGSWQTFGQRDSINRDYGSRAMYDVGRILVAGGGPSSADARVIDLNGTTPQVSATAPMATGRRQFDLTVLADGTVLATGGNSSGASLVDLNNGVYEAELWDPDTGQWRTLASMQVTRQYHSTALLLPDGRVLASGGGICGTCDSVGYLAKNAEVFSPPYLFKQDGSGDLAPRPTITSAPGAVPYDTEFSIATPDAASISEVALVRLGAVTHSVNMEQRYVPLSFDQDGGTIEATAPVNSNVAPPGVYMLFLIDADGVPSVAEMVEVNPDADVTAPETTITAGPNGPTNDPTPTFGFSAGEPGSSFECKLDGGSFAPCNPPETVASLPDGNHSFSVRAVDAAGNADPSPAERSFLVDTVAPAASISCPPAPAISTTSPVRCTATSDDPGGPNASGILVAVYILDTDPGPGSSYAGFLYGGPFDISGDGHRGVLLLAVDRAGNVAFDGVTVEIDTTAPDTTINSGPSGPTNDPTPTFGFSSSESGSSFECKVDGGGFAPCNPPETLASLPDGNHSFSVRAVDAAGNRDPSPVERSFLVDTVAPTASISCPPAPAISTTSPVSCTATSDDPGGPNASGILVAVYILDTDPGPGSSYAGFLYDGPFDISGDGQRGVLLLAIDRAINVSALDGVTVEIDTSGP